MRFTAVTARGTEAVLARELTLLGASGVAEGRGHVAFEGTLQTAYRACMFVRSGSRILFPIGTFETGDAEALYDGIYALDWREHVAHDGTLAVECVTAAGVEGHTRFLAQKTKDAICDQLRSITGQRPSVDRDRPDVRVHVHLGPKTSTVSIDLSGESMHRRSYRAAATSAPIKENLAAALLLLAGWDERTARGEPLIDPLCGSGTFAIEGALIAADIAPGLLREHHGMLRWRSHDAGAWAEIAREAKERARAGRTKLAEGGVRIVGFDRSEAAVRSAREAASNARVGECVRFEARALADAEPSGLSNGLLITNPPYGERLGNESELMPLYEQLGDVLKQRFAGFSAFVLTGSPVLAKSIGLRAQRKTPIWNGPIECRLLELPLHAPNARTGDATQPQKPGWRKPSAEAEPFDNRLRKNDKRWSAWAEREGIECYRVYDADIPEWNVAIDRYGEHAVVQEYAAPRWVDPQVAARRLRDVLLVVPEVLGIPKERVTLKVRRRQVEGGQYGSREPERGESERVVANEGGLRFLVSFDDHIDTGLFLDHRRLRKLAAEAAQGRSFLNLFAYTCTASIYAAAAGATETTSVDLSGNYLDWGRASFELNALPLAQQRFIRADCAQFLAEARSRYGVIFLNPPTYSRSHRMQGDFDIKRDHGPLIRAAVARLSDDGVLFFSTHARDFSLEPSLLEALHVEDISARSVPLDFERSPHQAFRIAHKRAPASR